MSKQRICEQLGISRAGLYRILAAKGEKELTRVSPPSPPQIVKKLSIHNLLPLSPKKVFERCEISDRVIP
jgi:DNA-binding phage protein